MKEKVLERARAKPGDLIKISRKGEEFIGILMPSHDFSEKDIVVIKLKNGYNIGIEVDENTKIEVIERGELLRRKEKKEVSFDPEKPNVSILGTGGTIASYVDYRTGAVHPAYSAEDIAFTVPEIFEICNVRARVIFQLLSENIKVENWQKLAKEIAKEFNEQDVKGIVISHGTDTMGYTSAALSFMLKNLKGPVVLVGAQRSSDRPSSDAYQNLYHATLLASRADIGEVVVVMHGEKSDTYSLIHRGTKVRKMHTSRRDAFKSINSEPIGRIEGDRIMIEGEYKKAVDGEVIADTEMQKDVGIIYFYPGMKPDDIPEKKGLVVMGTGLGHVSKDVISRLKELIENGSTIVMTSQCLYGRVNLNVYSTGRDLIKIGVIPCEDMLPEVAYVKLMWVLAHAKDREEIRRMMLTNFAGEISERRLL